MFYLGKERFLLGGGPELRRGGSLVIFLQIGEGRSLLGRVKLVLFPNRGRFTVFLARKKLVHVASVLPSKATSQD